MEKKDTFCSTHIPHTEHSQAVLSCVPGPHISDNICCQSSNGIYMFCKLQTK